ncbi:hypothetical protein, partial [Nocardioides massiliensis]|uniref:hypothetical protein n=1 Tax=Nocardioides massiliensis TaxID=1325935 RepID=UPI001C66E029
MRAAAAFFKSRRALFMLRASVTTVVTSALLALTSFLNAAVTARGLGVDGRGTLAAALLVVAVGRVLGLMGLGDAVVRAFGQQQVLSSVRRVLVGVLAIAALAGLTIGMLGVSITPLRGEGWPLLLMVVLWTGLGAMLDLLIAIARVQPSLSIFNFIRLAAPTLATSVTALVYFIDGLTVAVVLLVQVVTTVFSMVWATHSLSRVLKDSVLLEERPKNVDISLRGLARAGAGYQWIAMLGLVVTHGHLGIVMTVGSLHALGLYSAVFGLSRMIAPVQMSIGSAVFAASAQDLGSSSASGTLRAYRLSTALMLSIGVCVAAN